MRRDHDVVGANEKFLRDKQYIKSQTEVSSGCDQYLESSIVFVRLFRFL